MRFNFVSTMAASSAILLGCIAHAANQTPTLSPIVVGGTLDFSTQIQSQVSFQTTLPTLHSFVKANYQPAGASNSQWLLIGGMTNGMHDLGDNGFNPAAHNTSVYVVDPVSKEMWSRSLSDPSSGLSAAQIQTLITTNAQGSQIGSKLYIAGGYGFDTGTGFYTTYDKLTSFDLPSLMNWVKTGTGSAAASMRQISDPMFRVTGGEMSTNSNGKTHLIFGQDYPDSYNQRQEGTYTNQVRTFQIVDNAGGLSVTNVNLHTQNDDFRRRDLNVVPIIRKESGNLVEKTQALSGVFTPTFGIWTAPVTIDTDGNATQPDPLSSSTFKQGMNGYRCGSIGLYSATNDKMHTLLLGGISYQYYDSGTASILDDAQIPFMNDSTDIVTDAAGNMTQYLLPSSYPAAVSGINGQTLLMGAETEFFLKDGIATYSNGVINLDSLTGPTLIGWLYGGIVSDAPNHGNTVGSNAVFPVVIDPTSIPEPGSMLIIGLSGLVLSRRKRRR